MLESHTLRIGGRMSAHAVTRLSELLHEGLNASDEIDLSIFIGGQEVSARYLDDEGNLTAERLRRYLIDCIEARQSANIACSAVNWGEGGWAIESLSHEAWDLRLSARWTLGLHWDGNGNPVHPRTEVFGPDAPEDADYLVDMEMKPMISITADTDVRTLPRLAQRLRELSEWEPPPLSAHADLLAEIEGLCEAA